MHLICINPVLLSDNGQIITRANSGAARFQVRFPTGRGICCFTLASNDDCHKDLYKVCKTYTNNNYILSIFKRLQ